MSKFALRERVRAIGRQQEVRTVEEIRESDQPGTEPMYCIQLGRDFSARVWANESELELVEFEEEKFHFVKSESSIPNDLGEMNGNEIYALIRTRLGEERAEAVCSELEAKGSASVRYKESLGQEARFDIRRTA